MPCWGKNLLLAFLAVWLAPLPADAQYVGASRCRACHLIQYKSWEQTHMAKALDLLKPGVKADSKRAHNLDPNKDYTHDPSCISCHVTGHGQPGGFVSLEKTPELAGVQCEACHGPGAGYLKPALMSLQNKQYQRSALVEAGMVIPSEETCKTCHNPKSPFFKPFDYAARLHQGTHAHKPLSYKHD